MSKNMKTKPLSVNEAAPPQTTDWDRYKAEEHERDRTAALASLQKMLASDKRPNLGEVIRALLTVREQTQKAVALRAGIKPESFSRILNGNNSHPVSRRTIDKIITGLGECSLEEQDLIYRASDYVSSDISDAFIVSGVTARIIRLVTCMADAKKRSLLKQLEEGITQ